MSKVDNFEDMFAIGDKVFAKVKGYPHWPARIISIESKKAYNVRYHVHFYGTNQKGVVKAENVCQYIENKSKYGKLKKNKHFILALVEIERDLYHESQQEKSKSEKDISNKEKLTDQKRIQFSPTAENISDTNTVEKVSQNKSPEDSLKRKVVESFIEIEDPKKKARNLPDLGIVADKLFENSITISNTHLASGNNNAPNVDFQNDEGKKSSFTFLANTNNDDGADGKAFILASINESENVKIPLNLNVPHFTNENSKTKWYEMVTQYANSIKNRIENGEKLDAYEEMDYWTTLKAIEVTVSNRKDKKQLLRTEAQLIDLDINIRQSITKVNANADACLLLLDQLNNLAITPLMLKKQPVIVRNIGKIRNYVGNIKSWDMTEDMVEVFKEKAYQIRVKSQAIYTKFKALFNIDKCDSFLNFFTKEVEVFRQKTCSLTLEEVLSLTEEPE